MAAVPAVQLEPIKTSGLLACPAPAINKPAVFVRHVLSPELTSYLLHPKMTIMAKMALATRKSSAKKLSLGAKKEESRYWRKGRWTNGKPIYGAAWLAGPLTSQVHNNG